LHVASPFPNAPPKHEDDLIIPAREGTLRVLRAAKNAKVKRVVVTSSIVAMIYGVDRSGKVFSDADWTNVKCSGVGAYDKSKTLAEQAAWEFIRNEGDGMELVTINPSVVLGPMIGKESSTSLEVVIKQMKKEYPGCPNITFSFVDVRDVAEAHIAAMIKESAAGTRFLCGNNSSSFHDVAVILDREFKSKGFKIPMAKLPDLMVRMVSYFDKTVAVALNDLSNPYNVDKSKVEDLLGHPLKNLDEMVIVTAQSLIDYKIVSPPKRWWKN
jgi:dihydroflavonol-4-reductase